MPSLESKDSLTAKVRFTCIAGSGFFTDGYINLTIGLGMYCVMLTPCTPSLRDTDQRTSGTCPRILVFPR